MVNNIPITKKMFDATEYLIILAKSSREYFAVKSKLAAYDYRDMKDADADRINDVLDQIEDVIESGHIRESALALIQQIKGEILTQQLNMIRKTTRK